ncbi:putative nuclease HARBI1 [Ruditapes philippinarum]|uniref:putative nuclease HARBI1 n=1 Tax=Ruditapes philippinarum TaxID=129788 RepID=UPI00295AC18C|nr:putative nuclease HARBI1 [Ruditapes philippinarum]
MARRHFKERQDILGNLELIERYRLDRDGMLNLNDELQVLSPSTNRNYSLSSLSQVLTTLWYLATGTIQLNNADMHCVSQPTVSRVIAKVTDALSFITFNRQELQFIHPFSNSDNIQIQAPTFEEASYVNRMGYHSIITQLVFDANYKILDVVERWLVN